MSTTVPHRSSPYPRAVLNGQPAGRGTRPFALLRIDTPRVSDNDDDARPGWLIACIGRHADLEALTTTIHAHGPGALGRAARRGWWTRLRRRLLPPWRTDAARRGAAAQLLYGPRAIAEVDADEAAARPVVTRRAYFGERLHDDEFHLVASGDAASDLGVVIVLQQPVFSAIEADMQLRVPPDPSAGSDASVRVIAVAEWCVGDWVVRSAKAAPPDEIEKLVMGRDAGAEAVERVDPRASAAALVNARARLVANGRLRE